MVSSEQIKIVIPETFKPQSMIATTQPVLTPTACPAQPSLRVTKIGLQLTKQQCHA